MLVRPTLPKSVPALEVAPQGIAPGIAHSHSWHPKSLLSTVQILLGPDPLHFQSWYTQELHKDEVWSLQSQHLLTRGSSERPCSWRECMLTTARWLLYCIEQQNFQDIRVLQANATVPVLQQPGRHMFCTSLLWLQMLYIHIAWPACPPSSWRVLCPLRCPPPWPQSYSQSIQGALLKSPNELIPTTNSKFYHSSPSQPHCYGEASVAIMLRPSCRWRCTRAGSGTEVERRINVQPCHSHQAGLLPFLCMGLFYRFPHAFYPEDVCSICISKSFITNVCNSFLLCITFLRDSVSW